MITSEEKVSILERAYVPEHSVSLMALISQGDPFLIEEHFGLVKDNWVILVGYPLDRNYLKDRCERILREILGNYHPEYLWFIGPELPPALLSSCSERESDQYYELDLEQQKPPPPLLRKTEKALKEVTVERGRLFSKHHENLVRELLKRERLTPRLKNLYLAMPQFVNHCQDSYVLNAWTADGKLSAFYVVDLSAKAFAAYVLGGYSKKHYVAHASDLLFLEMVQLTQEQGRKKINLGLGVNRGIRRFKEKWGGSPSIPYEFCEHYTGRTKMAPLIQSIESKL